MFTKTIGKMLVVVGVTPNGDEVADGVNIVAMF